MIPTSSNSPQSWHPIFSPYIFWTLIICWPRQRQTTKSKRPSLHSLITLLKRSHDYDWIVESTRDFAYTTYGQDLKSRRGSPDSAEWQRSSTINKVFLKRHFATNFAHTCYFLSSFQLKWIWKRRNFSWALKKYPVRFWDLILCIWKGFLNFETGEEGAEPGGDWRDLRFWPQGCIRGVSTRCWYEVRLIALLCPLSYVMQEVWGDGAGDRDAGAEATSA